MTGGGCWITVNKYTIKRIRLARLVLTPTGVSGLLVWYEAALAQPLFADGLLYKQIFDRAEVIYHIQPHATHQFLQWMTAAEQFF